MKKIILAALASAAFLVPVMAQPEVEPYSFAAMGCMKLRECTYGVFTIEDYDSLVNQLGAKGFEKYREEIEGILKHLNKVGVEVNVAEGRNFPRSHRGVYYTDQNAFFLNIDHVKDPDVFMKVLRHEGWHAAQDCMAGTIDNSMLAIIVDTDKVPQKWKLDAEVRYGLLEPKAIPWESEAIWAGNTPGMTEQALGSCASDRPMWWDYEPTPKTAFWLRENGYNVTPPPGNVFISDVL